MEARQQWLRFTTYHTDVSKRKLTMCNFSMMLQRWLTGWTVWTCIKRELLSNDGLYGHKNNLCYRHPWHIELSLNVHQQKVIGSFKLLHFRMVPFGCVCHECDCKSVCEKSAYSHAHSVYNSLRFIMNDFVSGTKYVTRAHTQLVIVRLDVQCVVVVALFCVCSCRLLPLQWLHVMYYIFILCVCESSFLVHFTLCLPS